MDSGGNPGDPARSGVGGTGDSPWEYMASTSAFHGVGKIGSAPNRFLKVLWLVCLLGMATVMTYQLVQLTTVFFSWPVTTTVTVAFSPLPLPALTLCNTNPIRRSRVHILNCTLQALLRVDDKYKSQDCVNETFSLRKDPAELCERFNLFCATSNTEDIDMFTLRKKRTELEIVKERRSVMIEAGHQIEDFIINCSFNGVHCFTQSFTREWTMEYGNCYTMDTSNMRVYDGGPPSGLDILLDLQTEEVLTSYKTGYGVRVVVHEQGTRPFPSSEGFTLSAGFETHFGLREEEMERLGGRYGNCRDDSVLFDSVHFKYSTKACRTLCLERAMLERCGCTDALARTATPTEGVPICSNTTEYSCTAQVTKEYIDTVVRGDGMCACGDACREIIYKVRTSARQWPIPHFLAVLEEEVCHRAHRTVEAVAMCRANKSARTLEERSSSFVRLRVYYESLNYKRNTQSPFYNAERFLSDIGGTVGLWIGASLLGLGEALEFVFFSFVLLCRRVRGDKISLGGRAHHSTGTASNNGFSRGRIAAESDVAGRNNSNIDLVDVISTVAV